MTLKNSIIYLDNAATSWPKPSSMFKAMARYQKLFGASPGRSGHSMSYKAAEVVFQAREFIAEFFGALNSEKVIFTLNATHALNIALNGLTNAGDYVLTSAFEHNAVDRTLKHLEVQKNIKIIRFDKFSDLTKITDKNYRICVVNHASNVTGQVQPIREIGKWCKQNGILLVVDAAQSAGSIPINMVSDNIDVLCFTGHKGLYGPQGTGGMVINGDIEIRALYHGGTGSRSESALHPDFYPDRLEAGTLNGLGIAGLLAGMKFVSERGSVSLLKQELHLSDLMIDGIKSFSSVRIYGVEKNELRVPLISFNVHPMSSSDIGYFLDSGYGIMTRVGLHCAPNAHRSIGTFPGGTVRVSFGAFNTERDVKQLIKAISKLCNKKSVN